MKFSFVYICLLISSSVLLNGCTSHLKMRNEIISMDKESAISLYSEKAREAVSLNDFMDKVFGDVQVQGDVAVIKVYSDSNRYINGFSAKFNMAIASYCKEKYGTCEEKIDNVKLRYVSNNRNSPLRYSAWTFTASEHKDVYENKENIVREGVKKQIVDAKNTTVPYEVNIAVAGKVDMSIKFWKDYSWENYTYSRTVKNNSNAPYSFSIGELGGLIHEKSLYSIAYDINRVYTSGQCIRTGDRVTINPGTQCTINLPVKVSGMRVKQGDALSLKIYNKVYSFPRNPTMYSTNKRYYDALAKKYGIAN